MNAITYVPTKLLILTSTALGLVVFDNHRYGGGAETSPLKGYSGLHNQILKERKDFLLKFIVDSQPTVATNGFKPKDHISPSDVVGVVPTGMFKKPTKNSTKQSPNEAPSTVSPTVADSDTGESQIVNTYENVWSNSEFTPDRIKNHRYTPTHQLHGLYEKPYGRVRVHTYREHPKEYWVLPLHHKPEQKSYSPWGYFIKQPVGSEEHKFHSPLDLTFRYD